MNIRDRLRVWLGISDIQNQVMLTVDAIPNFRKDLERELNGFAYSLDNTAKGHRQLIDELQNTCREFNERLDAFQSKIGWASTDNLALSKDLCAFRQEYERYRTTFSERMNRAEENIGIVDAARSDLLEKVNANRSECVEALRLANARASELTGRMDKAESSIRFGATFWADQAKVKEDVLAHDRRLIALEAGDKSFGAHLAVVVDDAVRCERNRCAKIVEKTGLPFFRGSHRETLAKLIRGRE